MPIIPRGADDLALDLLVARLVAFSAREAAIDANVAFLAERDRITEWTHDALKHPLVVVEEDGDAPSTPGSAARGQCNYKASIRALCLVPHRGDPTLAPVRLAYLKEQVRAALFPGADLGTKGLYDLGRPTWTPHRFTEGERHLEETLVLGYWTFDLTYPWTPENLEAGIALDEISVAADGRSAIYTY